jgi:hypothetical protein
MAKKDSSGLIALLAGVAAGAAAVFFSKKENRDMVKREAVKAEKAVVSVAKEAKKNPKKFAKKVGRNVAAAEKKAARTIAKSPVFKKVGKRSR